VSGICRSNAHSFQMRNVTRRTVVLMTAAAVTLAACSSDDRTDAGEKATPRPDIQALLEDSDAVQVRILADGSVTRAELEEALSNTRQCLDEKGFDASWEFSDDSRYQWLVINRPGNTGDGGLAQEDCASLHNTAVSLIWSWEHSPTVAEQGDLDKKILDCVRASGVEVSTLAEARQIAPDSVDLCEQEGGSSDK